jgi:hypothetical protein
MAAACHRAPHETRDSTSIAFGDARADVQVEERPGGLRTYRLTTTAKLRGAVSSRGRTTAEHAEQPRLRTGNAMFDALHAMALDDAREASVTSIRTDDFDDGHPIPCDCFETGKLWTYVWTRDTAYSTDLALGMVDPSRARRSLEFKLSARRGGGGLEIVQDTGSGGSWPVSTDRVAWARGAAKLLLALDGAERVAFRDRAFEALRNTIERDRLVVWDGVDGLYRGEQSFLDWRVQSYPAWTATETLEVGLSKALSTNVDHFAAINLTADLAAERGDAALEQRYRSWAEALRTSIRERLWLPDRGMFSTYVPSFLDPAPTRRFDLLGESLAVLEGVADDEQAAAILRSYPHAAFGPPVVWPQEPDVAVYHNRAVWPFVTAYWMLAARRAHNDAVADLAVASLVRGAALELSNMENFELATGDTAAPVVDSPRQLWSVAGYLAMIYDGIFGREVTSKGIRFRPYVTRGLQRTYFAHSSAIKLDGVVWRGRRFDVTIRLPAMRAGGGAYRIASVRANGVEIGDAVIPPAPATQLDITLAAGGDPPATAMIAEPGTLDAPRTPRIASVETSGGGLRIALDATDAPDTIELDIYRDGALVAHGLPGTTREWLDTSIDAATRSPCYVVGATNRSSRNASHHSQPVCFWGDRIRTVPIEQAFRVDAAGQYIVQLVGSNPGDVTTGVTCAVARVTVEGAGQGYVFLPHGGTESSFVRVHLEPGRSYRVVVDRDANAVNMSAFDHFAHYTRGRGGRDGEQNTMHVDGARVALQAAGTTAP